MHKKMQTQMITCFIILLSYEFEKQRNLTCLKRSLESGDFDGRAHYWSEVQEELPGC